MKVNICISRFEISRYFVKCDFLLARGSSDGERLSQLYLELVDAYKKIYASKWTSRRIKVLSNMEENEKKF